ncbi:MAG: hypothetical protein L0Z55_12180 [Planctomycetes bacterium]|nr:hypothetical protein [Planctomycetota bacterium]
MSRTLWLGLVVVAAGISGVSGYRLGYRHAEDGSRASPPAGTAHENARAGANTPSLEPAAGEEPRPTQQQTSAPAAPEMTLAEGRALLSQGVGISHNPDGSKTVTPFVPFAVLRAIYARMLSGEENDDEVLHKLAWHLSAVDTPESIELLTRMLEDMKLDTEDFAHPFAMGLANHVDDRVFRAALARVESLREQEQLASHDCTSYMDLVARRKSAESAQLVFAYMKDAIATSSAHGAMRLAEHLEGRVAAQDVLEILKQDPHARASEKRGIPGHELPAWESPAARETYAALASWQDSEVDGLLAQAAFETGHGGAYAALAKYVEPANLAAFLAPYYSRDPQRERIVVAAIGSLSQNRALEAEERAKLAGPILREVIADLSLPSWSDAESTLRNDPAFHSEDFAAILCDLMKNNAEVLSDRSRSIRRTLHEIAKTLAKEQR